jgi:hypothetical protein
VLGRRQLLKTFLGLGMAAPAAPETLGKFFLPGIQNPATEEPLFHGPRPISRLSRRERMASQIVNRRVNRRLYPPTRELYPARIVSKRSWSAVYKEHVFTAEQDALEELRARLDWDESLAVKLATMLGVT